jgi:hypothetical protein
VRSSVTLPHEVHAVNITETSRILLALFGMQNRPFCPYLTAVNRTKRSMHCATLLDQAQQDCAFFLGQVQ